MTLMTEQPDSPTDWSALRYDEVAEHLNRHHALVIAGDRTVVLKEMVGPDGRADLRFLPVSAFTQWFSNATVQFDDRRLPVAQLWLKHRHRRQYLGIAFAPEGAPPGYYNLWRGFSVAPAAGDCTRFLEHVFVNVCQENIALFDWVIGWMAHMVQKPHEKLGTALVLRGNQGTGKSKIGEVFGSLFADHYVCVDEPRYVTGQFNSHLASCLLLHVDEGFWAGDHQAESKLKGLVTGREQFIEMKGREPIRVRNLVRLLITGNPDWVVPAGLEERRFAVLEMGTAHMQDHEYFENIDKEMENGGRAALLRHLLDVDLARVNLRALPDTGALFEQKVASLTPEAGWWFERLRSGAVLAGETFWRREVETTALFSDYIRHCNLIGVNRRRIEVQVGTMLKKRFCPGIRRGRASGSDEESKRPYVYVLPDLATCRADFARAAKQHIDWDE